MERDGLGGMGWVGWIIMPFTALAFWALVASRLSPCSGGTRTDTTCSRHSEL